MFRQGRHSQLRRCLTCQFHCLRVYGNTDHNLRLAADSRSQRALSRVSVIVQSTTATHSCASQEPYPRDPERFGPGEPASESVTRAERRQVANVELREVRERVRCGLLDVHPDWNRFAAREQRRHRVFGRAARCGTARAKTPKSSQSPLDPAGSREIAP